MATSKEKAPKKDNEETKSSKASVEFDITKEVDHLLQTLEGDLGKVNGQDALNLVERWVGFLGELKDSGTKEVISGLKDLQKVLKGGKATGHDISESLIHIGEQTDEIATDAEKGVKQTLQKLGKQIRKSGTSLAQAEAKEQHDQLDSLLDKVEGEKITSLNAKDAASTIDFWYNMLDKAEGDQFKPVATSLKSLKQALSKDGSKPAAIAKALAQVSEQTTEIASQAPRGFKGVIQKLGKGLAIAGQSLTEKG